MMREAINGWHCDCDEMSDCVAGDYCGGSFCNAHKRVEERRKEDRGYACRTSPIGVRRMTTTTAEAARAWRGTKPDRRRG